jgi:gliding motility-associated-like protein
VRKVRVKVVGMNHYVPNVFSPNNDNQNDRLQVYGTGIKAVSFKVYNRLGEVVYETDKWVEGQASDKAIGWDGFYKGKLQDSGNYTWLMSVTYINDTTEKKTGNVYLKY